MSESNRKPAALRFLWGDVLALAVGVALALYAAFSAADLPEVQHRQAERSFWAAALIVAALAGATLGFYIRRATQLSDRPERRRALSSAFWVIVPLAAAGGLLLSQSSGGIRYWALGGLAGILVWGELAHLLLVGITTRAGRDPARRKS